MMRRPPIRRRSLEGRRARAWNHGCMSFAETLDALTAEGDVPWGLISAALIVMVLTPIVARVAIRLGAFDVPGRDRPRVHTRPIPRIGGLAMAVGILVRSEEHTSELQSRQYLVYRLLLEKNNPADLIYTNSELLASLLPT